MSTQLSYVDNGSYGCVVRPSIPCSPKQRPHTVSKVFDRAEKQAEEYDMMIAILPPSLKEANTRTPFFAEPLEECKIKLQEMQDVYKKCENFTWSLNKKLSKDKPLWQIIYPDGGIDLDKILKNKTTPTPTFIDLFQGLHNIFKGLIDIAKNNIVHQDIKSDNIVYNDALKRCLLIDFGIAQPMSEVYDLKARFYFTAVYRYYPTEYRLMTLLAHRDSKLVEKMLAKHPKVIKAILENFVGHGNHYGYYEYYVRGTDTMFNAAFPDAELQTMYRNLIEPFQPHRQTQITDMIDAVARVAGGPSAAKQSAPARPTAQAAPIDSALLQQAIDALISYEMKRMDADFNSAVMLLNRLHFQNKSHPTIHRAYADIVKVQNGTKPLDDIFSDFILPLEEVQTQLLKAQQSKPPPVLYDFRAMRSLISSTANKIDVYMLGVAVLEVFARCLKTGRVGTTSAPFMKSLLHLLHSMTHFNAFERCTPAQAFEEYKRSLRHLRASVAFSAEEEAAIAALPVQPIRVEERRHAKTPVPAPLHPSRIASSRPRRRSLSPPRPISADEHKRVLAELQDVSSKIVARQLSAALPSTPELFRRLDQATTAKPVREITTEISERIRFLEELRRSRPAGERRSLTGSIRVLKNVLKNAESKMAKLFTTPRQKEELEAMRASRLRP